MRAAWITDAHLSFLRPPELGIFLKKLGGVSADAVFVTGDTAEARTFLMYLEKIREAAKAPVYYVLGNHDYYGSDIAYVRDIATRRSEDPNYPRWLPCQEPVRLSDRTVLVGTDGWADGRSGNARQWRVKLNDWNHIQDLNRIWNLGTEVRLLKLQELARADAEQLRVSLEKVGDCEQVVVLTHVPPYPNACWYEGKRSDPDWLPWFTCVSTGEVLTEYAKRNNKKKILVLCGHTHGKGEYEPLSNLTVRTGGWPPGEPSYGYPLIQDVLDL